LTPLVIVYVVGNVIENVEVPNPFTVKDAAETVPVTAGSVTPPILLLVPSGANTTFPNVVPTAILPKFISTVFVIEIGVMIVADPVAVPVTCALTVAVTATKTTAAINEIKFFMVLSF